VPVKNVPTKPRERLMTVAVGWRRPQPRPVDVALVARRAAAASSSQVQVGLVGISTPACSSIVVLANTT
jgi:hypothetical protein